MISVGICQEKLYTFNKKGRSFRSPVEAHIFFKTAFGPAGRRVINALFAFGSRYQNVFISQRKIASLARCTREWVNKVIRKLISFDLIHVTHNLRGTNDYYFAPFFYDLSYRFGLSSLFNAFLINQLLSNPRKDVDACRSKPEFTQLYNNSTTTKGWTLSSSRRKKDILFFDPFVTDKKEKDLHKGVRACKSGRCSATCVEIVAEKIINSSFGEESPLNGSEICDEPTI